MPEPKQFTCTAVGPGCPVEGTIYGYYPALGVNAFYLAFFGCALAVQLSQGLTWKTWTFLIALTLGCLCETVGYVGRVLLHFNPYSSTGFEMQICCLIIAPAFLAAGIYLTLKHLVIAFGPEHSRLRPHWYKWMFIGCDILSLVLQGAGGGIAASAPRDKPNLESTGGNLMLAGIVWQVATLLLFGVLVSDYTIRVSRKWVATIPAQLKTTQFKLFCCGLVLAYVTIFTRCVYRICTVAVLAMTLFHPGYCFPQMAEQAKSLRQEAEKKVSESESPTREGNKVSKIGRRRRRDC